MPGNTVRFHRVFRTSPERIYRAFVEPDAFARWLPPKGFTATVHAMDAKIGGAWRMSFTNFTTGKSHAFGGEYLELNPGRNIRYSSKFDDPNLPGEMMTSITLSKASMGTDVSIVQEGIPELIPLAACYVGWQESLNFLADLVETEIPN